MVTSWKCKTGVTAGEAEEAWVCKEVVARKTVYVLKEEESLVKGSRAGGGCEHAGGKGVAAGGARKERGV